MSGLTRTSGLAFHTACLGWRWMERFKEPPRFPLVCVEMRKLTQLLTDAGTWLSRPWGVVAVGVYIALWLTFDPETFNWQAVASIATLLMTLFIQRSEHRDTQAIHAKLDELLRLHGKAEDHLIKLDDEEPEQVEAFRKEARKRD